MILWNNVNLRTKGIIVANSPTISKGKKRVKKYDVEGKNGVLIVDKGTYEPFVCSLECHFDTDNFTIDSIKEFLDGYGTLSFDGEREYEAIIQNQIDFEKVQNFRSFVIQFLCNPIASDINATTTTISSNPTELNISATYNMYPTIELKGTGDVAITINNRTFYLYDLDADLTYTLDCNAKVIYNSNGINCSNQMQNDFPYLQKGLNTIGYTGTLIKFDISYKKAYL